MEISESRTRELLQWLDDQAGDHTHLFEQMARYRDAAALIRQLRDAEQAAWHAGMDEGREQGSKDHAPQPPSAPVEVDADELVGVRARLKSGDYDGADVMRAWLAIDKLLAQQPGGSDNDR